MTSRRTGWTALALALGLIVAACGGSHANSSAGTTAPGATSVAGSGTGTTVPVPNSTAGKPDWIVADWAIAMFEKAGMSTALVQYFFNNPNTFLIIHSGNTKIDAQLPQATEVDRFTSFATMQQAFSSGAVTSNFKAVMYDNEAWSFTPANEKADPVGYAAQAEALVHAHGMKLIFTPATNLAGVVAGAKAASSVDKYTAFVSDDLPASSAKVTDILDIQTQQAEATSEFVPFAQQAIAQAKAANPHATILIGIGPNPSGRYVSAAQIFSSYQSTHSLVSGYWFNMPTGTAQCPQCGTAQPQVAVSFFDMLASSMNES